MLGEAHVHPGSHRNLVGTIASSRFLQLGMSRPPPAAAPKQSEDYFKFPLKRRTPVFFAEEKLPLRPRNDNVILLRSLSHAEQQKAVSRPTRSWRHKCFSRRAIEGPETNEIRSCSSCTPLGPGGTAPPPGARTSDRPDQDP